jgi:DNA-binding CsgD family transcriptional regulator
LAKGTFGRGEKWDNPDKVLLRLLLAIILPIFAVAVCVIVILRKRYLKRMEKITQDAADAAAKATADIDLENMGLTNREKEICELLLTDRPLKEIAAVLNLTYAGANFHAQNVYKKLGIENRTELLVRVRREEGEVQREKGKGKRER